MDKAFHYIERVSDQSLRLHLDTFGAVLVEGPKWCGKTTSSRRLAVSGFVSQIQRAVIRTGVLPSSILLRRSMAQGRD